LSLRCLKTGLAAAIFVALFGCGEPPVPPEVPQAQSQERDLWRAGAAVFAPGEYHQYLVELKTGREMLLREENRFRLLRDYCPVVEAFRRILARGEAVLVATREGRERQSAEIEARISALDGKIRTLRVLVSSLKDRRLAVRRLVKTEVQIEAARNLSRRGQGEDALRSIKLAEEDIETILREIRPLLLRYADGAQVASWRQLVGEAAAESKKTGRPVIVISKIDRELTLYREGTPYRTYPAGMGFNFLSDKICSGDRATPEGKYRIVKKLKASKYFRALLINYPNEDDRRRFSLAKKGRQIPGGAGIGGLIEIHGGGKNGMTNGCIALENAQIEELFGLVEIGTPVIIVGAVDTDNIVSSSLKGLK
jgi:hypothetical protein